jgi:hypothetical protein
MTMGVSGIDGLVLEDSLIDRNQLPEHWAEILPAWQARQRSAFARDEGAVPLDLYTFV